MALALRRAHVDHARRGYVDPRVADRMPLKDLIRSLHTESFYASEVPFFTPQKADEVMCKIQYVRPLQYARWCG